MTSDSERALTPAEEAGAYRLPDYEDAIRQGGRIGDSIRRRHPYVTQEELLRVADTVAIQARVIQDLMKRVAELELRARTQDDYAAEMRDRG